MTYDKCQFNHELLVSYSTGNADPAVRNIVERHLAKCSHCRDEVVELEKAWWALNTLDDEHDSSVPQPRVNDLRARVSAIQEPDPTLLQKIRTQTRFYFNRYGNTQTTRFAVAAFIAVMAIIPWMQVSQQNDAIPTQNVNQIAELEAGFQEALAAGEANRQMHPMSIVLEENNAVQVGLQPSTRLSPELMLDEPIRPRAASYRPIE